MGVLMEWRALADDVMRAAVQVAASSNLASTEKGFADERYIALTLLARTISNARSAALLIDNRRIIEARVITRCVLENYYWMSTLVEDGDKFTRSMLHDTLSHKRKAGQRIFASSFPLDSEIYRGLRDWQRAHRKIVEDLRPPNPTSPTERPDLGSIYLPYEQLSSDSCHPSLDALRRHVVARTPDQIGGINIEPPAREEELLETLEYLTMALMGVCVGANHVFGGAKGGELLKLLADRFTALSGQTAIQRRPDLQ